MNSFTSPAPFDLLFLGRASGGGTSVVAVRLHRASNVGGVRTPTVVRVAPAAVGKEVRHHQQTQVEAPEHGSAQTRLGGTEVPASGRVQGGSHVGELRL